jgi:hypothetical protein
MIVYQLCFLLLCNDFAIIDHPEHQLQPAVAFMDSLYYVFFSDFRQAMSVYGCRMKQDGTLLDSSGNFFYQGYSTYDIDVCHDGQNIFFVFRYGC